MATICLLQQNNKVRSLETAFFFYENMHLFSFLCPSTFFGPPFTSVICFRRSSSCPRRRDLLLARAWGAAPLARRLARLLLFLGQSFCLLGFGQDLAGTAALAGGLGDGGLGLERVLAWATWLACRCCCCGGGGVGGGGGSGLWSTSSSGKNCGHELII